MVVYLVASTLAVFVSHVDASHGVQNQHARVLSLTPKREIQSMQVVYLLCGFLVGVSGLILVGIQPEQGPLLSLSFLRGGTGGG